MKSMKLLFTFLFIAAFATVGLGQITGSAHDFKGQSWNSSGEICIVCHTPHNAMTTSGALAAPLWNHRESTASSFTPYASTGTLNATVGQPSGVSKLCLSCHDGTVGVSDFGAVTAGLNKITGTALLGTDLSNDHPISFIYSDALATTDGGLRAPSTTNSSLGAHIEDDLLFGSGGTGNKTMECSSCHDVHRGTSGTTNLLRISNTNSALCLTCHNK
jgi:predicted CXXCH cytochrome family protein